MQVTSVFIHGAPSLMLYCIRWYPAAGADPLPELIPFSTFFGYGFGMYLVWQLYYVVMTEIFYGRWL